MPTLEKRRSTVADEAGQPKNCLAITSRFESALNVKQVLRIPSNVKPVFVKIPSVVSVKVLTLQHCFGLNVTQLY